MGKMSVKSHGYHGGNWVTSVRNYDLISPLTSLLSTKKDKLTDWMKQ